MLRLLSLFLILLALSLGLSGCGRKGPLEAPASQQVGEDGEKKENGEEVEAPDRPFILDGLLS